MNRYVIDFAMKCLNMYWVIDSWCPDPAKSVLRCFTSEKEAVDFCREKNSEYIR